MTGSDRFRARGSERRFRGGRNKRGSEEDNEVKPEAKKRGVEGKMVLEMELETKEWRGKKNDT